ncbi:MAG: ABC transporter permease subunit [Eubacteriales bacterium]|nr:ABC transporter permease subunit [Eubacteriales bacterium]
MQNMTRRVLIRRVKESWQWWLLLLPAFVYVCIFQYGPMYGLQIAFRNYRPRQGITGSTWVGLEQFVRFLSYPNFWKMIRNTLSITLYSLATFPCAVIFALMLNEVYQLRLKKAMQMITYAPHFMSEVVVCSLVLMMLDRANGPINNLIAALGGERYAFMTDPGCFPSIYVWSGVWQNLGWDSILFISALASISPEVVEAARIDGANRLQIIRHVNIPGILPTIAITFIMRTGGLLSVGHTKIFLLQNDLNLDASQVISTYVYNIGLVDGQYSYSTAIGLFNNLANILVLLLANAIVKKTTDTGLF